MTMMRNCTKCKEIKNDSDFNKGRTECRSCQSAYAASYYKDNQEKFRNKTREYYKANIDKVRVKRAAIYAQNKEKEKAKVNEYRLANPEKVKATLIAWRASNPHIARIHHQNRRARKIASGGSLSPRIAEKLLKLQCGKCACCGERVSKDYHLDHIIPLAIGGAHSDENIQILCKRCNLQKHAKHPIDFMQSRGFLL